MRKKQKMEKPQSFILLRKNRRRFHFFIDSHGLRWISKKLSHFHQPNEREREREREERKKIKDAHQERGVRKQIKRETRREA